jgi:GTPase SAR1 family protein
MELLFLTITNVLELSNPPQTQQAFWWYLIPVIIGIFITVVIIANIAEDTKNVVILGPKASGKTTLWNQLRGLKTPNSHENTSKEEIKSFSIKTKTGIERKISTSYDIGGGDQWVADYDKLIKENKTFILFLIDLTNAEGKKSEVRARLLKIFKIIEDKKLEDCGIKILGTFHDKYRVSYTDNADTYLKETIDLNSISNKLKNIEIMSVNLLDISDVEKIKQEVSK